MKIEINNADRWHQSLTVKLALLGILGLILMVPLEMIKEMIKEREANADKVMKDISLQWGGKQCFSGPVLNIPFRSQGSEKDAGHESGIWHILPENLDVIGDIDPEIRYKGIYKSVVYDSKLSIRGDIAIPQAVSLKEFEILWDEAYFTAGITDNRGLKGTIRIKTGDNEPEAEPGVRDNDIFNSGISFPGTGITEGDTIHFEMDMNLSGSEGLLFTPLGKNTSVVLGSDWDSPRFSGGFLPGERTIDESGFTARWEVTHLNRNYPQSWTGSTFDPLESSFGVDLFQPVDHYQKSWRSSRYGILFIALTFFVLIFLEVTRKEAIHIFHYFLVSLGLVLFFSLLNSLSEQTGFNVAYLISALATVLLISIFTLTLFRDRKPALTVFMMLTILYSFIFVLLTLDEYAYLAGNAGLFILLAVIMKLSGRMELFKKTLKSGNTED